MIIMPMMMAIIKQDFLNEQQESKTIAQYQFNKMCTRLRRSNWAMENVHHDHRHLQLSHNILPWIR